MSHINPPSYILCELPDLTEHIKYPIKNVQRIKYTCFDVSKTVIAFGATSGGVYVFNRNPCEFVQLIPNKDGAITRLAISVDEKHIGFANGKGMVTVTECSQSLSAGHSAVTSKEHQGNEVTALAWSSDRMLFSGDDVGKISVLQLQNFIAKAFQMSQVIMNLDSRICQIDIKACMLLVSTLTRCYICDTYQEQYRQIGHKLRDGEFGACFVDKEKSPQNTTNNSVTVTEVKQFNMVAEESKFAVDKKLENTLIFCARPSSRLWESSMDGAVMRTHQFKQVLAKQPMKVITLDSYENENICIEHCVAESQSDGQAVNFTKIYSIASAIFTFRKNALYFLNLDNLEDTVWYDKYNDIVQCKVYQDMLYVWLSNGSLVNLEYMKIDKFLLKCYVDEKYVLCAELCALYREYLLMNNVSTKLYVLVGLKDKLEDNELLRSIGAVLDKFESFKELIQAKSGIYVVDNTHKAQSSLLDENSDSSRSDDYKFSSIPPEAMQTLKDLTVSVSDKINTSKKMIKEKWEDFEGKMKNYNTEKQQVQEIVIPKRLHDDYIPEFTPVLVNEDIIYKESSQKAIEVDNNVTDKDKTSKSLYQYYILSLVGKETDNSNLISIIEQNACDIKQIYDILLLLEQYCVSIEAIDESKHIPNYIFLTYLNVCTKKGEYLKAIVDDDALYKYFVDSCITVNMKSQSLTNIGCECGFPLPYSRTSQCPFFSELIDDFIEIQWSSKTRDQCYDICKRMPYLWRKILYLRRNEDLLNILRVLVQMLDESLLHTFLPQFTLESWNRAVQLYATLHSNICLNCTKKFDHISVKDTMNWDDLGALMIKSVGGNNAIKILEQNAGLIDAGAITVKFYHTCLLVIMFEKFDATVTNQLIDAIYKSYDYEEARIEICKLLRNSPNGIIKHTALPIAVAATSTVWGLKPPNEENPPMKSKQLKMSFQYILDNLNFINNGVLDCALCGLPLQNKVLIQDGGLWVFKCGHTFHGACLDLNKLKLCPSCTPIK